MSQSEVSEDEKRLFKVMVGRPLNFGPLGIKNEPGGTPYPINYDFSRTSSGGGDI